MTSNREYFHRSASKEATRNAQGNVAVTPIPDVSTEMHEVLQATLWNARGNTEKQEGINDSRPLTASFPVEYRVPRNLQHK